MLARAGPSGVVERDHDRERGIERAATEVAHLQTRHRGRTSGAAPEQEHARDRSVVEIVARPDRETVHPGHNR